MKKGSSKNKLSKSQRTISSFFNSAAPTLSEKKADSASSVQTVLSTGDDVSAIPAQKEQLGGKVGSSTASIFAEGRTGYRGCDLYHSTDQSDTSHIDTAAYTSSRAVACAVKRKAPTSDAVEDTCAATQTGHGDVVDLVKVQSHQTVPNSLFVEGLDDSSDEFSVVSNNKRSRMLDQLKSKSEYIGSRNGTTGDVGVKVDISSDAHITVPSNDYNSIVETCQEFPPSPIIHGTSNDNKCTKSENYRVNPDVTPNTDPPYDVENGNSSEAKQTKIPCNGRDESQIAGDSLIIDNETIIDESISGGDSTPALLHNDLRSGVNDKMPVDDKQREYMISTSARDETEQRSGSSDKIVVSRDTIADKTCLSSASGDQTIVLCGYRDDKLATCGSIREERSKILGSGIDRSEGLRHCETDKVTCSQQSNDQSTFPRDSTLDRLGCVKDASAISSELLEDGSITSRHQPGVHSDMKVNMSIDMFEEDEKTSTAERVSENIESVVACSLSDETESRAAQDDNNVIVSSQLVSQPVDQSSSTTKADKTGGDIAASNSSSRMPAECSVETGLEDDDDMWNSSFEIEEDCPQPAPVRRLRSLDESLPGWARFDRYTVQCVTQSPDGGSIELKLVEHPRPSHPVTRTITLLDSWADTSVQAGDTVHVVSAGDSDLVSCSNGALLVVSPDLLVSGTSVVSGVQCRRRAVLSEWFGSGVVDLPTTVVSSSGADPVSTSSCKSSSAVSAPASQASNCMLVGTVVHRLFQQALCDRVTSVDQLNRLIEPILRSSDTLNGAYSCGMSSEQLKQEMTAFYSPLLAWIGRHTAWGDRSSGKGTGARSCPDWSSRIQNVIDIEENCWSPRLGVKGKVDVTVSVNNARPGRDVLPLELKTGRASFSAEHLGQVTLYAMMCQEKRPDLHAGLLVYLRSGSSREVTVGCHQRRDLIQLRNQLASSVVQQPAAPSPAASDSKSGWIPRLPETISSQRTCQQCAHLYTCHTYSRASSVDHSIPDAGQHLSDLHVSFFIHWSWVVMLESEQAAVKARCTQAQLWTVPAHRRQAMTFGAGDSSVSTPHSSTFTLAGCCITAIAPSGVDGDSWFHQFQHGCGAAVVDVIAVGDWVILSTEHQLAVAQAGVVSIDREHIKLSLDRKLPVSDSAGNKLLYHLDKRQYGSQTLTVINLANLAQMLNNSPHSDKLRSLIIDRRRAEFVSGLDRSVVSQCRSILRPLNKLQQRSLLRALMAKDYLLIRGMPGTGKTVTIVALIRLLVARGLSVLLASHTHSAVDTVLLKLKRHFGGFLRLGRRDRVHSELSEFLCENLLEPVSNTDQLTQLYNSRPVVATTCLGINHSIFSQRRFDVCILDESSQIVLPTAVGPLLLADRFVLVGDEKQLPPVVARPAARQLGLDSSLFQQLVAKTAPAGCYPLPQHLPPHTDCLISLSVQYRMNERLMEVANLLTYDGAMSCGSDSVRLATLPPLQTNLDDPPWLCLALSSHLSRSVVLLDSSRSSWKQANDVSGDVINSDEAQFVADLVQQYLTRGLDNGDVGVVTPYRGQVDLLRAIVPEGVEVNTVDQYQGRDKLALIYSCVRTKPRAQTFVSASSREVDDDKEHRVSILCDWRRLNVATTRARVKLVLVAHREALLSFPPFCKLFSLLSDADCADVGIITSCH